MTTKDPVLRVSVVSTGHVQIRPDHEASTWRPTFLWLLTSREWTGPKPINAYVIEHRDGLVLFDTGQDRASVTEPDYFPGGVTRVLYDRLARFEIGDDETLDLGLRRLGYEVGDVSTAVVSHLHQDHIGGLGVLSHADILVSQKEWDTLSTPLPELRGLMRRHIDLPGLRWRRIDPTSTDDPDLSAFSGIHDIFGDAEPGAPAHTGTHARLDVPARASARRKAAPDGRRPDLRRAPFRRRRCARSGQPPSATAVLFIDQGFAISLPGSGDPSRSRPWSGGQVGRSHRTITLDTRRLTPNSPPTPQLGVQSTIGDEMNIDTLESVDLGSTAQWIRVRGTDIRNPLLLLIQQGPGLPMINEARRFGSLLSLEECFTVVYWDQRGCGLSLRNRRNTGTICLEQMTGDTVELLEVLHERYGGPTFVAGFSFGATIGAHAAARRPDLVAALVVVGTDIDGSAAGHQRLRLRPSHRPRPWKPKGYPAASRDRATPASRFEAIHYPRTLGQQLRRCDHRCDLQLPCACATGESAALPGLLHRRRNIELFAGSVRRKLRFSPRSQQWTWSTTFLV